MTPTPPEARSLYALVTRSAILSLSGLTLLTLVSVFFYLSSSHQREYEALVNEQISFLEANLEGPMWTFHTGEVSSLGKTLLMNEMVAAVMIKGADGQVWVSEQNPQRTVEDMRQGVVFHNGQAIGSFELGMTRAPFRDRVWKGVLNVALTALGALVLITLLYRLLLDRHLRRPLRELLEKMDALAEGTYLPAAMDAPGEIQDILEHFNLASERVRQRENELRKSREQFSSLFNNIPFGAYRSRADGTLVSANPAALQILGCDPAAAPDVLRSHDVYADFDQREQLLRQLRKGPVQNHELRARRLDGKLIWLSISARATYNEAGEIDIIDGVFEDSSQKHQAALDLGSLLGLSRALLTNPTLKASQQIILDHALTASGAEQAVLFFNRGGELVREHPPQEDRPGSSFDSEELLPFARRALGERSPFFYRLGEPDPWGMAGLCRASGLAEIALLPLAVDEQIIALLALGFASRQALSGRRQYLETLSGEMALGLHNALLIDELARRSLALETSLAQIQETEEQNRRLQQQITHSQKLQAIGTLAGGIAHDFNNILQALFGHVAIARIKAGDNPALLPSLQSIDDAANRASQLVGQILAFSRRSKPVHRPIVVADIVRETLRLLRASLPDAIEVRERLESDAVILGDATQLHQVVMNLCTNARHAMAEGGILSVEIDRFTIDQDFASRKLDIREGDYLRLAVADTGCGMSPEVVERIFEPFYTTRDQGEGNGMGLSVVHGIVKSLKGGIQVSSQPGRGSRFEIFFPLADPGAAAAVPAPDRASPPAAGRERILFVDDEAAQCELAEALLVNFGYRVETFNSPLRALEAFRGDPQRCDLVLTDLTMPQLTGDQLARALLDLRPDLPIILCTGFSDRVDQEGSRALFRDVIHKPIVGQQLAQRLRSILENATDH